MFSVLMSDKQKNGKKLKDFTENSDFPSMGIL
jgi:hypothetical protein